MTLVQQQHRRSILLLIIGISIAAVCIAFLILPQQVQDNSSPNSLTRAKSGLFVWDSLKKTNLTRSQIFENFDQRNTHSVNLDCSRVRSFCTWTLYGSAIAQNLPVDVSENTVRGLALGLKSAVSGKWASYSAMSRDDYGSLFHAVLTMPKYDEMLGDKQYFSTRLVVQTSIRYAVINYVACVIEDGPGGRETRIENGIGSSNQINNVQVLWSDIRLNQPVSRDCTIITNGNNNLKVYIDNSLVYSNEHLSLQMSRPFNSHLAVLSTYPERVLYGFFKDYYSTAGENLRIINAPPNGLVKIVETLPSAAGVGKTGKLLANGTVNSNGVANLNIGQYHFPLNAQIQVYNSTNSMVASTPQNISLYGGDIYSVKNLGLLEKWLLR